MKIMGINQIIETKKMEELNSDFVMKNNISIELILVKL